MEPSIINQAPGQNQAKLDAKIKQEDNTSKPILLTMKGGTDSLLDKNIDGIESHNNQWKKEFRNFILKDYENVKGEIFKKIQQKIAAKPILQELVKYNKKTNPLVITKAI